MYKWITRGLVVSGMAAAPLLAAVPAASAAGSVVYVSPGGSTAHHNTSCRDAGFNSIQAAVNAVALHGDVIVCPGTYHQSVTVTKSLSLIGARGAVIDAAGNPYGVGLAADFVTVTGLTVKNAKAGTTDPNDGIITAGFVGGKPVPGNHETIVGNLLEGNAGAGIDLNSTTGSVALRNISILNGIGINVSNDLGKPASHNLIFSNYTSANPGGCGIVLADHTGVGIFSNWVNGNTANDNGLGTPSAPAASSGSGIILAGGSGGVYNNAITHNFFFGNGHAGVALHAHAPGLNFSGNKILWNWIGTNNLRTDFKDLKTTGVYLGDVSPLTITVAGNFIHSNSYGIFKAGPVTVSGANTNLFLGVTTHVGSTPAYGG
jgi:hypothetical protein